MSNTSMQTRDRLISELWRGDTEAALKTINAGLNLNLCDSDGMPIHVYAACRDSNLPCLQRMYELGCRFHSNNWFDALSIAIQNDAIECVTYLIQSGAPVLLKHLGIALDCHRFEVYNALYSKIDTELTKRILLMKLDLRDHATLQWVLNHGSGELPGYILIKAVENDNVGALEMMMNYNAPQLDAQQMFSICSQRRNLECAKLLMMYGFQSVENEFSQRVRSEIRKSWNNVKLELMAFDFSETVVIEIGGFLLNIKNI